MARVTLGTGENITIGGVTEVFGTSGAQSVTVIDGSLVTFRSGFNSGGDTIRLTGNADDFTAVRIGSNIQLSSIVDGITISIPVGVVANTIVFDNGDVRELVLDPATGNVTLGDQTIGTSPVGLTAGPGVYSVQADGDVTEGGVITFTVTRTDTTSAETLQFTVQGDTNGGSLPAATPGSDFTVAGNAITFAAGQATATFTVAANVDNLVEGLEGLGVKILSGSEVVAETTALIIDGNTVGQTFQLTPGIDTIGTGAATDLIGSEGSTNTDGQDTIIGTAGVVNLLNPNVGLGGDFNPFDNINGGADRDTLIVLDQGNVFTSAPNFTGVTIQNVEELQYSSPTRGFSGNLLNTTTWTGLDTATVLINASSPGATQTVTMGNGTSLTLNQLGSNDLVINGGGGTLAVTATTGNVTSNGTGANASAFTSASVIGGNNVTLADGGAQELATVMLNGFTGDANITGTNVSTVGIMNLSGGAQDANITASNVAVTLTNVDSNDFDLTASNLLTVNADGTSSGVDDITAGNNVVVNSTSGTFNFDVLSVGGGSNSNRTVSLNADGGGINLNTIVGTDIDTVNLTGSGNINIGPGGVPQSNDGSTVINASGSGNKFINAQLGNGTQYEGSQSSGIDNIRFGASNTDNNFGAGNDLVYLNAAALGVNGSLDGGDDFDTLFMNSNDAAAFTAGGPTATSNFEALGIGDPTLPGGLGAGNTPTPYIAKHDVIDLGNIGFTTTSDVISNVGAGSETEVATVSFAGVASSTDSVTFDGITVNFADEDGPAELAAAFIAQYNGAGTGTWVASAGANPGDVVLTSVASGERTDLTAADFVFTDAQTLGSVGLEQSGINPLVLDNGNAPVPGIVEVRTLSLDFVSVLTGETITITEDIGGGGFPFPPFVVPPAPDPVFTFVAPADVTHVGGELASFFVAQWNAAPGFSDRWVASVDGNNVVFTATTVGDQDPDTVFNDPTGNFTVGGTGLSGADVFSIDNATVAGADPVPGDTENVSFALDGVATGNDQLIFDGSTITFEDGDGPNDLASAFQAQYNGTNWTVVNVTGPVVTLESVAEDNLPNLTPDDFEFVDDTNVGTPSVGVTTNAQGTTASVTLNNFISGSTLTLTNIGGTHTVNMTTDTAADVLNLSLQNNDGGGNHGTVTANQAETVNITTGAQGGNIDNVVLNGTDVTTIVASGPNGLTVDTNSSIISSIDATGLGGFFSWTADASQSVAITVSTGANNSLVDFSAMTIQGGVATTGNAPVTFLGGSGNDTIITGDIGTSRGTITTGAGFDDIQVGIVDGGNDFWSVTDFTSGVDDLLFDNAPIFRGEDQQLEPTATFQDYLDQAARGDGDGSIRFFYFDEDGDGEFDATYVVQDNTDGEDFVDGSDTVIRLEGVIDLQPADVGSI